MKIRSIGYLLLLAIVWGAYYVVTQQALTMLPAFAMGFLLRLITALILTTAMAAKQELHTLRQPWKNVRRLVLVGVFGFLLDATAFLGLRISPAGIGTVLLKCDVLFVNLISAIVYHYRFTKKEWLFTGVMLAGVILILGVEWKTADISGTGNWLFILSALFVSINAFLIRAIQRTSDGQVSNAVIAYYNNFVTMSLFALASVFSGETAQIIPAMTGHRTLPAIVALGAAGQAWIYKLYYDNLRRHPVWLVKVFLLLMPMAALLLDAMLFRNYPDGYQVAGMIVLLAGTYGILTEQRKKKT